MAVIRNFFTLVFLLLTPGYFVNNNTPTIDVISKIIISVFTVGLGAGVVEEMIFRGFIMHVLKYRWGKRVSIIIPSIIFGLGHATAAMNLIDILMLFIAGTSVGIMFSLIAYESKTIWSSAFIHAIWNITIIGNILNIGVEHTSKSIFSYVLTSKSIFVTGGQFGIEASGIAIIGYLLVICLTKCNSVNLSTKSKVKEL